MATISRLEADLEVKDGLLKEMEEEGHKIRNQLQNSIPIEEVHVLLDGLGAPRLNPDGKRLFIKKRFAWVHTMLHGRRE